MDVQLSVAIIGVAAALLGSAIGAVSSYFSTRSMRKLEWRMSRLDREIDKMESLYADFLSHTNTGVINSLDKSAENMALVKNMVNLETRIQLVSPEVGVMARKLVKCVLDHHQKADPDNPTYPALRDEFIKTCKASLDAMRSDV